MKEGVTRIWSCRTAAKGPSLRELAMQALSSVEGGYDLLAPKFDHTPFRTPDGVLDATAGALRPLGPFGRGLDVCCGTGAGMRVLRSLCQGPVMGVDFSTGMLAQARSAHPGARWVRADVRALPFAGAFDLAVSFGALGHFLPAERPALFAGVYRALRPGGVFAFPVGAPQPTPTSDSSHSTATPSSPPATTCGSRSTPPNPAPRTPNGSHSPSSSAHRRSSTRA